MYTGRTPVAALVVCAGLGTLCSSASAQSFEDRWSIIPKANAQESAQPDPAVQTAPEDQTNSSAKATSVRTRSPKPPQVRRSEQDSTRKGAFAGKASYISYAGGKTASGAPYRPQALTAAHRTLPFGTRLRVTDLKTGRQVQVTVNDRGPFIRGRVLDLSRGAAQTLGMTDRGVIQVRAEVLSDGKPPIRAEGS
jgi:rare lipoprotein A